MSRTKRVRTGFWTGFVTHAALMSLVQDSIGGAKGAQGYCDYLLQPGRWVDRVYTVPLALVALLVCVRAYHQAQRKKSPTVIIVEDAPRRRTWPWRRRAPTNKEPN